MVTSTKQKQLARKLRSLAKKSQICRGILGEGWLLSLWTKFWSDWPFIYVWQFSSLWMKSLSMTIQVKANEQYLYVELVLTIKYVDGILKCDHSNESYWAVLSCGAVYYAVRGGCKFSVCGWNPKVWPFEWLSFWAVLFCGAVHYASIVLYMVRWCSFLILWNKF